MIYSDIPGGSCQVYIDYVLYKVQPQCEPPKGYPGSYMQQHTRGFHLPHAEVFHRMSRRKA